jgi:peptidoglycan/xylan/chitin deacetylase (PgdA/CDA1 family)
VLGLALAAAATLGVTSAGYQTLAPTGQWFGRAFCGIRRDSKQIALTFDDGPNDPYTLKLLDVLSRYDAQATFFLIGRWVHQRPDIAAEVARRGHAVGNHTFTHPLLVFESDTRIRAEILNCRQVIGDAVGDHSRLFRPPWGGRRPAVFRVARRLGLDPVMWNVTGYDWKAPDAAFIEQKITRRLRGGDVVLLHDGSHAAFGADRSRTIAAVDSILARYRDQGFQFVGVPEMMSSRQDKRR